jgi:hypothetical protein
MPEIISDAPGQGKTSQNTAGTKPSTPSRLQKVEPRFMN